MAKASGTLLGVAELDPVQGLGFTRCATTLAPKVNLSHAIDFGALCGKDSVTLPSNISPDPQVAMTKASGALLGVADAAEPLLTLVSHNQLLPARTLQ